MARVITFSRHYPAYHSKAGQPTFFVEKIFTDLFNQHLIQHSNMDEPLLEEEIKNFYTKSYEGKGHTIREGNRWKVGDWFSPRVWGIDINPKNGKSGPYQSKQIIIAPIIQIKKVWNISIWGSGFKIEDVVYYGEIEEDFELLEEIGINDGLNRHDLLDWLKYPKPFVGQIICWNENINY